jgi:aryl-alcohol dehydrogenase-like predicted oxidoreductase
LAQLSLAWVLINKDVSTAIMGCSSIQQLEHNINAVQLYLKFKDHHQLWQAIENALDNRPTPQTNFRTM